MTPKYPILLNSLFLFIFFLPNPHHTIVERNVNTNSIALPLDCDKSAWTAAGAHLSFTRPWPITKYVFKNHQLGKFDHAESYLLYGSPRGKLGIITKAKPGTTFITGPLGPNAIKYRFIVNPQGVWEPIYTTTHYDLDFFQKIKILRNSLNPDKVVD